MTRYIKYSLIMQEPIRIADDSSAKQGQTETLRYIPGSTIRGYVINSIKSVLGDVSFGLVKKELFSEHVRFQNAYLTVLSDDNRLHVLIPSPKGFYEDKQRAEDKKEKEIQNVVLNGVLDERLKRAKLGSYAMVGLSSDSDEKGRPIGRIEFYTPQTVADTKIRLGEGENQDIFRTTSIMSGYCFTGYIALDNADYPVNRTNGDTDAVGSETLGSVICQVLREPMVLGNARSTGLGKCSVLAQSLVMIDNPDDFPYVSYMREPDPEEGIASSTEESHRTKENHCYMMLLSDTCMRNSYGEYCGLDLPSLETALGVTDLKIIYCSTSVTDRRGFNRNYGGAIPSVAMYEKGSVFHLAYHGHIDKEHLDNLHQKGIGLRRNEGFGQVLFIRDYESIKSKIKGSMNTAVDGTNSGLGQRGNRYSEEDDNAVIYQVAKTHYRNLVRSASRKYIIQNSLENSSTSSQLGNILSIAMANQFQPDVAWNNIRAYFKNKNYKEEKYRVHSSDEEKKQKSVSLRDTIDRIENTRLSELLDISFRKAAKDYSIMNIPISELMDHEEEQRAKLELLIDFIRYNFKGR